MGLAASQARLLTITARKSDCEFQSMSLSHQKIALSRDMEKISDEYQAAMNKTKLVYDFYGTGTSQMNLNYSLLMTPSVYNDYFPKLLTDKQNRVVLAPEYAAAAKAAGIPYEGYNGTPSSEIRNIFVEALCNNGIISATTALNIESVPYNNAIGLGELYSGQQATMEISYDDLLELIKANCQDTADYGCLPLSGIGKDYFKNTYSYLSDDYANHMGRAGSDGVRMLVYNRDANGNLHQNDFSEIYGTSYNAISLYDLLDNTSSGKDYVYMMQTLRGPTYPAMEAAVMQSELVGDGSDYVPSFLNWLTDQFAAVLGGVPENDVALQYAYNQVLDLLYPTDNYQEHVVTVGWPGDDDRADWGHETDDDDIGQMMLDEFATKVEHNYDHQWVLEVTDDANYAIGMVYSSCGSGSRNGKNRQQTLAVNLNNIAQVFLTAFKESLDGAGNSDYSYELGQTVDGKDIQRGDRNLDTHTKASLYYAHSDDIFTIKAPTQVNDGSENLEVNFYDAMFNIICTNGWTENENINNAEYMQELLKNGSVYISSIDNDAYYYQASYSTDTYISEIADTEAIAQAEAKYNAQKARIENKENTIDMKMKNLDTEISALTTEYDTMKNVINKSIEKSFKRYDA